MQLASLGDSGRQTELRFQLCFNGASDVVGQAAAGPGHDALSGVDLSCGGNADARKALRFNSLLLEELFGSRQHRGEDGRLVVVEADALLRFGEHTALFVHDAQFDGSAANVNGKILFHSRISVSFVHGVDGTGEAGSDLRRAG